MSMCNQPLIFVGEKPHQCEVCGKPFRVRSDMRRHERTHTKRGLSGKSSRVTPKTITKDVIKTETGSNLSDEYELSIHEPDNPEPVQILGYDPDQMESGRDGSTLYVMIS